MNYKDIENHMVIGPYPGDNGTETESSERQCNHDQQR